MPVTTPTRPTAGRGRPVPKGADPAVWALAEALLVARERLPYATAEARLLDGLQRWVALEAKAPGEARLRAVGARWAAVVGAVSAVARLCSPEAQALLAPWAAAGAGAPGAPGVSPHAAQAAAFVTFSAATGLEAQPRG